MKWLKIFLACILCGTAFAQGPAAPETVDVTAVTTTTGGATTNEALAYGWVDAVSYDVTVVSGAYALTNGATDSDPSIIGGYFLGGTYASSNYYVEDGGSYYLFYTGGVYQVSTNLGSSGVNWTNTDGSITGTYTADDSSITGVVEIVALYADFDLDVKTTTDRIGQERTLLTLDDVSADGIEYVRAIADNTDGTAITGEPIRIPLQADKWYAQGNDSFSTGITVEVDLILSPNSP